MTNSNFVFDLSTEDEVAELARSIAWHLPSLVESVDDIDEGVLTQALESVVSDLVKEVQPR